MSAVDVYRAMKKKTYIIGLLALALLLGGCSRKGVNMNRHRKKRHCDCPTFSYLPAETDTAILLIG